MQSSQFNATVLMKLCNANTIYPISEEVILEGPSRLEPDTLLWVVIRQKQTTFLSYKYKQRELVTCCY